MSRARQHASSSAIDGKPQNRPSTRRQISSTPESGASNRVSDSDDDSSPIPRRNLKKTVTARKSMPNKSQQAGRDRRVASDDHEEEGDEEDAGDSRVGADDQGDERDERNGGDAGGQDEDESDDEDEEGGLSREVAERYEGWNVQEFKQRPLTDDKAGFIPKLLTNLTIQINTVSNALTKAQETATAFEDIEEDSQVVEQIAGWYLDLLDKRMIMRLHVEAVEELAKALKRGPIADPVAWRKTSFKGKEAEWKKKTLRQKFKDDLDYKHFRQTIWDCHHAGQPCPDMTDYLPAQAGDEDDAGNGSDDDVRIGTHTQVFSDPIALTPFVDAVVVEECGHHYSRATIIGLLEQNKGSRKTTAAVRIKCPRSDCRVIVTRDNFKPDPQFQARVDAHYARQTQRKKLAEAEATDEEVVDYDDDEDEDEDMDDGYR